MTTKAAENTAVHHLQQHGKGLQVNGEIKKVKVLIGDEEREVEMFKIVAKWIKPKDPEKPVYVYTYSMIVKTLYAHGIIPKSPLHAVRIKVNSIYKACSELIVYDNRPGNPFSVLAFWQNGEWLDTKHPATQKLTAHGSKN